MNTPDHSLLGKAIDYPIAYDPSLLFAIARADNRAALGLADALPFHGVAIWNAYELGWLDARGKPRVAMAEFRVPADPPKLNPIGRGACREKVWYDVTNSVVA